MIVTILFISNAPVLWGLHDFYITSGYSTTQLSTSSIFENYCFLNFGLPKIDLPCEQWDQRISLALSHTAKQSHLRKIFKLFHDIIHPECKSPQLRSKRSISGQRANPLVYVGWVTSRVMGYAHAFDLETINDHLDSLDKCVNLMKKTVQSINEDLFTTAKMLHSIEDKLRVLSLHNASIQLRITEQEYLYINSALRNHPNDCTSTRRKNNQLSTIYHSIKATYTGICFNRESTNIDSTSTHRYTFEPTILQITKIYRRQKIIFKIHQLPFQLIHSTKITFLQSTTEEKKSITVFPTKTTTHATQRITPSHNNSPNYEKRCHVPLRPSRSNSTKMILTGSNHTTSRTCEFYLIHRDNYKQHKTVGFHSLLHNPRPNHSLTYTCFSFRYFYITNYAP
jgi:hypothetical protein